jgi:hypothetical protein
VAPEGASEGNGMSTTALADITLETSILPTLHFSTGEATGSSAPSEEEPGIDLGITSSFRDAMMWFLRPRLTLDSSLLKSPKIISRHGTPFFWPLGHAIVVLPIVK